MDFNYDWVKRFLNFKRKKADDTIWSHSLTLFGGLGEFLLLSSDSLLIILASCGTRLGIPSTMG